MEIEITVKRYGADQFAFAQATDQAMIQFRLTKSKLIVRFILPLTFRGTSGQYYALTDDKQIRQRWRALLLCIKAKLEAVETGIETVEHAFLGEIVLPDGKTLAEKLLPEVRALIEAKKMPQHALLGYYGRAADDHEN